MELGNLKALALTLLLCSALLTTGFDHQRMATEGLPETPTVAEHDDAVSVPYEYIIAVMGGVIVLLTVLLIREKRSTKKFSQRGRPEQSVAPSNEINFRIGNLQNIGRREEQQDSFCISDINDKRSMKDKGLMAVVADGMGGMEGGAAISQLVTTTFREHYAAETAVDPHKFLYETARAAETAVENYRRRMNINGGSTLVAVLIKNGVLHFISIGDSRIYLLRQNNLAQLNHEHTFGAFLKEQADKGEVAPNEPYINPKRDALTAYVGMGSFRTVDRGEPIRLSSGDKILLCSDGVFNALGDSALIAALSVDAIEAAEQIERNILSQNISGQDNFTGVIIECVAENEGG